MPLTRCQGRALKVLSFNVDTNFHVEEGYARLIYPEWRVRSRIHLLLQTLQEIIVAEDVDVVHIQEACLKRTIHGEVVDSVTPITRLLRGLGYEVEVTFYSQMEKTFCFITAVHQIRFRVYRRDTLALPSGSEPDAHGGEGCEDFADLVAAACAPEECKEDSHSEMPQTYRCTPVTYFEDREGPCTRYVGINIHLGESASDRLKASHLLSEWAERELFENSAQLIFIMGDFHTHLYTPGAREQMQIFGSTESLLECLTLQAPISSWVPWCDKIPGMMEYQRRPGSLATTTAPIIPFTKVAYPFDLSSLPDMHTFYTHFERLTPPQRFEATCSTFASECKACHGIMDHVLTYGFALDTSTVQVYLRHCLPDANILGLNLTEEESMKQLVNQSCQIGPVFPSDHLPLLATLDRL